MLTVMQAAAKLGLTDGRIRQLLLEGRIEGAALRGWIEPHFQMAQSRTKRARKLAMLLL
jgi:hypothetical protein